MIACKYLLWNQSSSGLEQWLPKSIFSKFLLRRIKKTKPKFARFSIQYEVHSDVIPVGMKSNVLYVKDPQKPLLGPNFLHLHFYYPTELQENSPIKTLIVTYLLPHEALQQDDIIFDSIHAEITERLQELMPFSQGKIELKFPKDDAQPSDELLFPLEESDYETFKHNAAQNPIYDVTAAKFQELFPFPHRTLYKNLILTGPEILAALGFEGEFLLGLKTTDYVWGNFEKVKKKGIKQRRIA